MADSRPDDERRQLRGVHEQILRAAEQGEDLPDVDLERVSVIARQALAAAASGGQGIEGAERAAQAALARSGPDSEVMNGLTVHALESYLADVPRRSVRRDFVMNFFFAAILPILGGAFVWWLATSKSVDAAKFTFGVLTAVLGVSSAAAVFLAAKGHRSFISRTGLGATLVGSGGAITAGLVVLLGIGSIAYHYGSRDLQSENELRLIAMNQAAAVTLAAVKEDVSVSDAQAAVSKLPEARWFHIKSTEPLANTVLAEGKVTQRLSAELRTVSIPASEGRVRYAVYVADKTGPFQPYVDYVLGTVVAAEIDRVVISTPSASTPRTYSLPRGTLPPTVKATVVAAVKPNSDKVLFLQSIDGVAQELSKR